MEKNTWAQKYTFIPRSKFGKCKCKTHSFAIRTQFTPLPNNISAESKTRLYFFESIVQKQQNMYFVVLDIYMFQLLILFLYFLLFLYAIKETKRKYQRKKRKHALFSSSSLRSAEFLFFGYAESLKPR